MSDLCVCGHHRNKHHKIGMMGGGYEYDHETGETEYFCALTRIEISPELPPAFRRFERVVGKCEMHVWKDA